MSDEFIWVFNGIKGRFPGGVFQTLPVAEAWITKHKLTGMLTQYPVDVGVYDWSVARGDFTPKKTEQLQPDFIGAFSSASQEHYHYEEGVRQ